MSVAAIAVAVALLLSLTWTQVSCLVVENRSSTAELFAENRSLAVTPDLSHNLPLVESKWVSLTFKFDANGRLYTTYYPEFLKNPGSLTKVSYTVDSRFCRDVLEQLPRTYKELQEGWTKCKYSSWQGVRSVLGGLLPTSVSALREVADGQSEKLPEPIQMRLYSGRLGFAKLDYGFDMFFCDRFYYPDRFQSAPPEPRNKEIYEKGYTVRECIVDMYAKMECEQAGQRPNCVCSAGYWYNATTDDCLPCKPGTYSGTVDSRPAFCSVCPAGSKCSQEAMREPVKCSLGEACPEGTAMPGRCLPGFVCRAGAAPQLCPQGSYCKGDGAEPAKCFIGAACAPGSSVTGGQGYLDDSSVNAGGRDTAFSTLSSTTALGAKTLAVDCNGGALLRFKMRARPVADGLRPPSGEAEMAWSYECGSPLASTGVENRTQFRGPQASGKPGIAEAADAAFGCADGYAVTGFSVDYSGGDGVAVTKCSKVDTVPGSCKVKTADFLNIDDYPSGYQRLITAGTNSLGSLSMYRASCKSGVLQGFKVVLTEVATTQLTCCDLKDDSPIVADLVAQLANATTQVTLCGVRHGWITPATIRADLSNLTLSPRDIEDRFFVFSERATEVLLGMKMYLTAPNVTKQELLDLREPVTKDLDLRVEDSLKFAAKLAAGCPGAPIWRWVPVCTSKDCEFTLTQTVTNSWESGSYNEFGKAFSESSSQSYGQALGIGRSKETGSSTMQSDTYSVSASAGFEVGFASGSVELGYSRTNEASQFQSQSITSDTTRTMDTSLGMTRDTSENVGRTLNKVLSQERSETCGTKCDGVLYQWTMFQLSPAAKEAKVTTCTFVCRAPEQGLPVCPGGRCKDDQCSTCLPGTFKESAMDAFYSDSGQSSNLPTLLGIGIGAALLLGAGAALAVVARRRRMRRQEGVTDLSSTL